MSKKVVVEARSNEDENENEDAGAGVVETPAESVPVTALLAIDELSVEFQGDLINGEVVEINHKREVYIPLRPVCQYLGLNWSGQYERVKRDPVLKEAVKDVRITRTSSGRDYDIVCLPLKFLPGWLFGINVSRIKHLDDPALEQALKAKLIVYQKECFDVLWEAFAPQSTPMAQPQTEGRSSITTTTVVVGTSTDTVVALEQIKAIALAVAQMADQQLTIERRLNEQATQQLTLDNRVSGHDLRLDRAAQVVKDLRQRLEVVEKKVAPPVLISDEQAAQLSSQVKALAVYLQQKDPTKTYFGSVYGTIYNLFGVSSYSRIRRGQFEAVMQFLQEWRRRVDEGDLSVPVYHGQGQGSPVSEQLDMFEEIKDAGLGGSK